MSITITKNGYVYTFQFEYGEIQYLIHPTELYIVFLEKYDSCSIKKYGYFMIYHSLLYFENEFKITLNSIPKLINYYTNIGFIQTIGYRMVCNKINLLINIKKEITVVEPKFTTILKSEIIPINK